MLLRILAGMCVLACTTVGRADLIPTQHIQNGSFGTTVPSVPSLAFWTTASNTTSNWSASDASPFSSGPYAVTGNAEAQSDQRLFQEFTLPSLAQQSATLSWVDQFFSAIDWEDGALEYRVILQRVVAGIPVGPILEAFSTAATPAGFVGPTSRSKSDSELLDFVSANLGQSVRLTFEALDNGTIPVVSVDTVSFITVFNTESVPEPSSLLLAGLSGLFYLGRRRKQQATAET
jgi:hypothetical protein